jgi:hypothetical protein
VDKSLLYNYIFSPLANWCLQFVPLDLAYTLLLKKQKSKKSESNHSYGIYLHSDSSLYLSRYLRPIIRRGNTKMDIMAYNNSSSYLYGTYFKNIIFFRILITLMVNRLEEHVIL